MAQVFDGITVLDFTSGRAGGVTTMVMSDFGAEVIKVEPPGGEKFRNSPGSIQWNRGKKSVVLDLKTREGRDDARELARRSDVVIENFRPGVAQRLGIDYATLRDGHPGLVYATLTGFGSQGPYAHYKGYDAVVAAKSGRMMMFAEQDPPGRAELRGRAGRLPRGRHGADPRRHRGPLRAGKDRPGPAGGDQHAEGRDYLRSRLLGLRPDDR